MNRREFLAAAATASSGPILLGMTRKAEEKNPVIGVEGHKYECVHNWGELPGGYEWQTTHNVALDAAGNVYITHQGSKATRANRDTVMVFDPKGKFVRSFGKEWINGGHGIAIRKEGGEEFIYLSNTWEQPKLVKTTLKGEEVWRKGRPECKEYENPKAAYSPTNISWLPDGGFTVGDGYGSHYMFNYDKDGKLQKVFGGAGTEPGKFKTPHGQWLDDRDPKNPVLVVCDRANARLQRFTPDGTAIDATEGGKVVLFPAHAKTRGDVLLVPDLHARVSLFDKENKPIVHLGDDAAWRKKVLDGFKVRSQPKEWLPGKFVHPHDAAFDADGNIFVVEWVSTGRITLLRKV
ncbi:peptidase [Gemmata sp. JC673]|uniref:Peptidase n=1 Tax=Gemmata algarum TaxID=2975278 RepID=A0ABU5EX49_9BACT|nr:peptidase [Gemmata algarum]MDY3559715.1 peptidase [Gemmata algarum]